jgi:hypothetical protein
MRLMVLLSLVLLGDLAAGQPPTEAPLDEIIVRGRVGELRRQMLLAEDAVHARFNEINSDDDFDIHCLMERRHGSRIEERVCRSNSWREQEANMAQAIVRGMQAGSPSAGTPSGEGIGTWAMFRAEQLRMQRLLQAEVRRLGTQDQQLTEALLRLEQARWALATPRAQSRWTLGQEVTSDGGALPYDAQQMFEVRIGSQPWSHFLRQRTFTIAHLFGEIRGIEVECAEGSKQIEFEAGVEWTVSREWSGCFLEVDGKKGTTFALYEFE